MFKNNMNLLKSIEKSFLLKQQLDDQLKRKIDMKMF